MSEKIEKSLKIMIIITLLFYICGIIWFMIMIYKLSVFQKCYSINFNETYCEKYKNF